LANLFIKENLEFIEDCKGKNEEYVKWYGEMVDNLEKVNCHMHLQITFLRQTLENIKGQ
jgi:hypothetical protein